ncbi:MAG: response regulator [Pirellulaceae bacterium]|nr:response regulator [Pirellulaceae bacterium]
MLVLSRKEKQNFIFPGLGITVQILRVQSNRVKVGITAPESIQVLRGELSTEPVEESTDSKQDRDRIHAFRNQLNTLQLSLALMQAHLKAGCSTQAESTLRKALASLEELEQLTQEKARNQAEEKQAATKPRALVVEDNAQERELLAEFLRVHGYDVEGVGSGEEALDYLTSHASPDMVLLDMYMPGMDGHQTAKAIRCDRRFDSLKLFVVSGADPNDFSDEAKSITFDHWFSKPIQPQEFVSQLTHELATS